LGDRRGIWPVRNLSHLSPKFLFHNSWREKTDGELAHLGSSGKMAVKVEMIVAVECVHCFGLFLVSV